MDLVVIPTSVTGKFDPLADLNNFKIAESSYFQKLT